MPKEMLLELYSFWRKPKLKIHVCSVNYPMLWKNVPGLLYSKKQSMECLKKSLQNHKEQNQICRNAIIDFQPLNPKLLIRLNIMFRRRINASMCFIRALIVLNHDS